MVLRIALFLLMALGLAGLGGMYVMSSHAPNLATVAAAPPPPAKVKVLVAAHPLRGGSLLKPEDVTTHETLASQVPAGASMDTPQARTQLFGAMVRRSLGTGEPVLPTDIMRPGDHGFLAAVLGPNMRAVTVGVDVVSGSAGLIWPGDRVDVILTQTIDSQAASSGHRFAAETVLSDVRVIAIDQQLVQGASPDAAEPKTARTVTLEVTAGQSERVAVAERLGHLSLVVRSADQQTASGSPASGHDADPAPAITWAGDVSPALNASAMGHGNPSTMRVFQGNSDGKEFHF